MAARLSTARSQKEDGSPDTLDHPISQIFDADVIFCLNK
jgi:hypothetical protein